MRIAYYISGHGFGHAVRSIEIIKELARRRVNVVHIRTLAPLWLFSPILTPQVFYMSRDLDAGIEQPDSFSVDKSATLERNETLLRRKKKLIRDEVNFLQMEQIKLVVSDISPLAFDAAEQTGIPSVGVGNFSWDWIYQPFLSELPDFEAIVDDIKASYNKASLLLRLPFFGDMSAFQNIEDVPLVGRKSGVSDQVIRQQLNFSSDMRYVLLGLRMQDMKQVNWDRVNTLEDTTFVAVSRNVQLDNVLALREGDIPYESVLAACDAVLSKPGYSIVSECIVNQTPLLYVPREDFVEDASLVRGLEEYAVANRLPMRFFQSGSWEKYLDALFEMPQKWPEIGHDGAGVVADRLLEFGR